MGQYNIYRTKNLFFRFIQIYIQDSPSLCFLVFFCGFLGFLFDLRRTILLATPLFFSTPVKMGKKIICNTS